MYGGIYYTSVNWCIFSGIMEHKIFNFSFGLWYGHVCYVSCCITDQ